MTKESEAMSAAQESWSAPGPGPWALESSHWSLPMSVLHE